MVAIINEEMGYRDSQKRLGKADDLMISIG
jgi:hypothetical protein